MVKKKAMGRGLSALLTDAEAQNAIQQSGNKGIAEIPVASILANPFQPRVEFDEMALEELAESIKVHGIIQPITVREKPDGKYELVSGERRTRASKIAGLSKIPAFVRQADDQEMVEMALIENIQRENLNAIEIALSYQRLIDECQLKQEDLAERVGKNRSTVNNYLRLLKLPDVIQLGIKNGLLSMGHARALLGFETPNEKFEVYKKILHEGLNVRQVEALAKKSSQKERQNKIKRKPTSINFEDYNDFVNLLKEKLHTDINFKTKGGQQGQIIIPFDSKIHLETILDFFDESAEKQKG